MAAPTLNVLSLCSGVGGLDLGIRLAVPESRVVCWVEREAYAAAVLVARMSEGRLDEAPVWSDAQTFDGRPWRGVVDLLAGGYPCQGYSQAGKRKGFADPRDLWPDFARIIAEVRPPLVFVENVAAHLGFGFDRTVGDLQTMGYDIAAGLFSALEVGAPHIRARLFALGVGQADPESMRQPQSCGGEFDERRWAGDSRAGVAHASGLQKTRSAAHERQTGPGVGSGGENQNIGVALGNANQSGLEGWGLPSSERDGERASGPAVPRLSDANGSAIRRQPRRIGGPDGAGSSEPSDAGVARLPAFPPWPQDESGWERLIAEWPELAPAVECSVRRTPDGLAGRLDVAGRKYRVDRLRACGNGVVPQTAALAFRTLMFQLGILGFGPIGDDDDIDL